MKDINPLDSYPASTFYDTIISNRKEGAEAAYYLLKCRLTHALKAIYEVYGFGLGDGYDDTIEDFFLYLHDSSQMHDTRPFGVLGNVRNKEAFFAWVLGTYRRFLLNKAKEEAKRREMLDDIRVLSGGEERRFSEETLILFLATAIAYADQQFVPRNRFILYRMLLTLLDHRRAIPQEAMAQALDMMPVTYRVCNKRQKERFMGFILLQETGHPLELDATHSVMCERIVEGFSQLYTLLLEFYDQTLTGLPTASDIQALRLKSVRHDGLSMHEESFYGFGGTLDARLFYKALKRYSTS